VTPVTRKCRSTRKWKAAAVTPAEREAAQQRIRELTAQAYRAYRMMPYWLALRITLYFAAALAGALAVRWLMAR
jgi:hypothetical protein